DRVHTAQARRDWVQSLHVRHQIPVDEDVPRAARKIVDIPSDGNWALVTIPVRQMLFDGSPSMHDDDVAYGIESEVLEHPREHRTGEISDPIQLVHRRVR